MQPLDGAHFFKCSDLQGRSDASAMGMANIIRMRVCYVGMSGGAVQALAEVLADTAAIARRSTPGLQ